jgi:hypothetical protein
MACSAEGKMRVGITLLAMVVIISGCTEAVTMQNKATGETATCGPYKNGIITGAWAAQREAQCISDYQRQGYDRVPN